MAANIEFDRDAVGVSAKKDWEDADTFAKIGSYMTNLPSPYSVAQELPAGSNTGVVALRNSLADYGQTMRWVILEYSDACSVLGSGQEEAISDFDSAEYQHIDNIEALAARMGG
ncbi:hypothetical protein [Schaalia vaccimaxillae]|uniref:hypothetical protein n=1 Tax=Schaalia vaccimaxillae TaxID=183916 RepID=UPI0003B366C4|nr:hypothetical protein [Schaalia vaccimaxillae]